MTVYLVTGAAGFIGYHLAEHLSRDSRNIVICADNHVRGEQDSLYRELTARANVTTYDVDLTRPEEVRKLPEQVDYLFHLAALNGTQNFYQRPYEVLRHCTLPAFHLIDYYGRPDSGLKRFVYASTSETYAGTVDSFNWPVPTAEDVPLVIPDPANPRWSYAASKLHGEVLVHQAGSSKGFPFTIIRYHNVYGPRMGDKHVMPDFARRLKEGRFELYGYTDTRSFMYIDDAVKATVLCAHESETAGETVNVGGTRELSMLELAEMMMNISGIKGQLELHPSPRGSVSRRAPVIDKLLRLTSYREEVPLEEGIKRTLDYYLTDERN
ncbi:dTDP-glucose 4,6-dehydratase [compost metagenome]